MWPSGSLKKAIQRSWSSILAMRCGWDVKTTPRLLELGDGERDVGATEVDAAAWLGAVAGFFEQQAHAGTVEEGEVAEAEQLA